MKLNITEGNIIWTKNRKIALGRIRIDIKKQPFTGERERKLVQSSLTSQVLPCHPLLAKNQRVGWVIKRLPNCCILFIQEQEVAHVG
jgi:hypothetical protein